LTTAATGSSIVAHPTASMPSVSSTASLNGPVQAAASNGIDSELSLDDRYSVASDGGAVVWNSGGGSGVGGDLVNNSDSDLESASPSKYTPYSTFSSNYSSSVNTHPQLNANLIQEIANNISSNHHPSSSSSLTNTSSNNSPAIAAAASNNNADVII
jgi:hypothetical protein